MDTPHSNNHALKKIGFLGLFSLVIGSQIGSGVIMLPAKLAAYGWFALLGWLFSGCGALALAFVFARLAARYPKTGGAHAYVLAVFGRNAAFFVGWTYWLVSALGTASVAATAVSYMSTITGPVSVGGSIICQLGLFIFITGLNLRGVCSAGHFETILAAFKIITLLAIPCAACWFIDLQHITISPELQSQTAWQLIASCSHLTLWAFIGLEAATTPAGSVDNPKRTIPLAILSGTFVVLLLYIFNSFALMGLIPQAQLLNSPAPYVTAGALILPGNWQMIIAVVAIIICVSNLNAWILASGQIAYGIAQDGLFPRFMAQTNASGAPIWGIILSSAVNVPMIIATIDPNSNLVNQVQTIIQISVTAFVFVYAMAVLAFLVCLFRDGKKWYGLDCIGTYIAMAFCISILFISSWSSLAIATLFVASGLPFYYLSRHSSVTASDIYG